MKKEWAWIALLCLCIIIILPWSIVKWSGEKTQPADFQIRVLMPNGKVESLGLEDYLVGVVAAEMPAQFATEALKAQAVAARTFAAKRLSRATSPDPGYDVDTTTKTQAWLSDEQMRKKWGGWFAYWRNRRRIERAVTETRGLVMVENGEYIDAFYHSSTGRKKTETSEDVWGTPRPYLRNVSSEEENPLRFVKKYTFSAQQLCQKLGLQEVKTFHSKDLQIINRTAAGRIKTLSVLGKVFPATAFRAALGLASTDIEWEIGENEVTMTTYGNGHAVGMSQYGANDMASKGQNFKEILGHFYPGTKIVPLGQQP